MFPQEMIFRVIGRIAFPIFCFLIVEGYFHTRDIRRYMIRLGAFALLSEIPYDLAFHGSILEFGGQNVFFTLMLGVLMLYAVEKSGPVPVKIADILLVMWAAGFLCTDYGYKGILLIFLYYVFHEKKLQAVCAGALWNFINGVKTVQNYGVLAAVPLAFYNGERGPKLKYFFYIFYPGHLLVLYMLSLQGGY